MINEIGPRLDKIIQDLRSSRWTTNDRLPSSFQNSDILTHTERLISSASTVIAQGSTIWGGSEIDFSHSSAPTASGPLDKVKKSHIENWRPQVTITEEEGSQTSEQKALIAVSDTVVEERELEVEEIEYSDSDGDDDFDFAQKSFERAERSFLKDEHAEAVSLFRTGLKRADRLAFEKQNRLEYGNIKREMALSLFYQRELEQSEELFRSLLESLAKGTNVDMKSAVVAVHASSGMAQICLCKRVFDEAEDWCRQSRIGWRRTVGKQHPLYIDSLRLTAFLYELKGDLADASTYDIMAKEAQVTVDECPRPPVSLGFSADHVRDMINRYHQANPVLDTSSDPQSKPAVAPKVGTSPVIHVEDIETPRRTPEPVVAPQTPDGYGISSPQLWAIDVDDISHNASFPAAKETNPNAERASMQSNKEALVSAQTSVSHSSFRSCSDSIISSEIPTVFSVHPEVENPKSPTKGWQDSRSRSSLLSAARKGNVPGLEKYLNKGAPIEHKNDKGETALCLAVIGGHSTVISNLLARNAAIETRTNKGCTPLLCAKENLAGSRVGVMRTLLDAGAQIDAQDQNRDTAISHAAGSARPDWVKCLLDYSPSLETRNKSGKTILLRAADFAPIGYAKPIVETVKLLLDGGANVKAIDGQGQTAVLLAIRAIALRTGFDENYWQSYVQLIRLLCARGVDATLKSSKGASPLSCTGQIKNAALKEAVVKVLRHYAAT